MSNDTRHQPAAPVVPGPWETAAAWGRTGEIPAPPAARPWDTAGIAPWAGPEHRIKQRPLGAILLIASIVLAVALIVSGAVLRNQNVLPVGVPLIGMDSGVAACKAIAEDKKLPGSSGQEMTRDQYLGLREVFASSRYDDIRSSGVQIIDIAWLFQSAGEGDITVLAYVGPLFSSYNALSGACSAQGYTIPALAGS